MPFAFNLINKKVISRMIVSMAKQAAIERNHEQKLKLHEKVPGRERQRQQKLSLDPSIIHQKFSFVTEHKQRENRISASL
jgi:hypothetical protein